MTEASYIFLVSSSSLTKYHRSELIILSSSLSAYETLGTLVCFPFSSKWMEYS
jgi:hypothetical protein